MKRFLLTLILLSVTILAIAQQKEKGDLQIGIQGGASLPISTYKSIGETKVGYYSGFFVDKYFSGNKFGLGIDARYIYNSINRQDTFRFENGYISTDYINKTRFQDYLFTFGPSYKYSVDRFHVEAYIRGGLMMQYFPEYVRSVTYEERDPTGGSITHTQDIMATVNDASNRANSWAGVGGLRFNYMLNKHFALFGHVDYVQTFGEKFGGKSSQFAIERIEETNPILETASVKSVWDHYGDVRETTQTPHKTVQTGIGVKYIFGKKKSPVVIQDNSPKYDEEVKKIALKGLQIVVKDKQTNLALSGVTVSIEGMDINDKSVTDANGQASKVSSIKPGKYQVVGEKNGIKTPILTLTEADFQTSSAVIFKEIYHDDPRFTLIGETFDCATTQNLAGINTVLTHTGSKVNASQTSDAEGKFIYQLDAQSDFTVVANQQGRYSQTEIVSTKGLDRSQTLYVTLKLGVCELVENGEWVLKNIHYDFDKSNIRADAAIILNNVVAVMKQNPTLRIELSSHTDSRGNDDYNLKLSQRRADSAVDYLIANGIAKTRLVARGYGETKLLNHCGNGASCSEQQHQENRRTEIKVLQF